jgi:hypothetical protein
MIALNLTANNQFAAPGGYPCILYPDHSLAFGFLPPGFTSVTATAQPACIADIHLALYDAPTTSLGEPTTIENLLAAIGSEGALVSQADALAVYASTISTLSATIPYPNKCYAIRIWYDNAVNGGVSILSLSVL